MGAKTVTTIDAIKDDLRSACADRTEAWRDLVLKDSPGHRVAWEAACDQVDSLLEMLHGFVSE